MIEPSMLATYIASRICHDLISPVASVNSALELLDDTSDAEMKAQAEQLLVSGAEAATARLQLLRYAFGSAGLSDSAADRHEVKTIIESFMSTHKPSVEWDIQTDHFSCSHARVLMNMVILAAGSIPRGGTVHLKVTNDGDTLNLTATAIGPRAKISDYTTSIFNERLPEEGWSARTIQPLFTRMVVDELGGRIECMSEAETVTYQAMNLRGKG